MGPMYDWFDKFCSFYKAVYCWVIEAHSRNKPWETKLLLYKLLFLLILKQLYISNKLRWNASIIKAARCHVCGYCTSV